MKNQPVLTDEFKNAITNLVIDEHASSRELTVPDDARAVLQAGLEQSLVDPDAMYDYLYYLNHTHRIRHPFRHSELLPLDVADNVVQLGLSELKPEQLAELALNPYQLSELQELLSESEPSDVWWPIVRRYNREAALLAEAFDEHREELEAIFSPPKPAVRQTGIELAYFGETDGDEPPAAPVAEPQRAWHEEIPFDGPHVEWLEVSDPVQQQADRVRTVRIDFAWNAQTTPPELTVRLGAPLLLGGVCSGVAELRDSNGQPCASGKRDKTVFRFQLSLADFARATSVAVTYDRPSKYRVRLTVSLSRKQ